MFSKREREGYLVIDHRASPGIESVERAKMPQFVASEVGEGGFLEAATLTCSHCSRVVILEPKRTRERGYCRACDHYICDACAIELKVSGVCMSFDRRIEQQIERERAQSLIIAP